MSSRLALTACLNGGVILALEILGARWLAPTFGATIHLWTAQIVVTLAALSVGYAWGGRLSGRPARLRWLAAACLLAALWIAAVPWMGGPCAAIARACGFRYGVLLAATLVFAPPLAALGIVLPVVTRIATEGATDPGRSIGDLYALSTVGSIAGALVVAYVGVPYVPVPWIFRCLAVVLAGCGVLVLGVRGVAPAVAAAALAVLGAGVAAVEPGYGGRVLWAVQTPYNDLRVVETERSRRLYLNRWLQGSFSLDGRPLSAYFRSLAVGAVLRPTAHRVLVVGLGAGGAPRLYAELLPDATVETVEIDPGVIEAARRWFGFPERLAVWSDDGRRFLDGDCGPYDIVAIDAYANGEVPVHLATLEFFRLVKLRMAPDGIVVTQIHGAENGPTSAFWHAVWRTLAATFTAVGREHVRTQRVDRVVLVASDGAVSGDPTPPPLGDVPLLTDAYAPVEALCAPLLAETFARWQEPEVQ